MHLDRHGSTGFDRALPGNSPGAANVASNIGASNICHRIVVKWDTSALGAVLRVSVPKLVSLLAGQVRLIISTPSTHSCWNMEWAATFWTASTAIVAKNVDFIVPVISSQDGDEWEDWARNVTTFHKIPRRTVPMRHIISLYEINESNQGGYITGIS